jgi:hypothetical protein
MRPIAAYEKALALGAAQPFRLHIELAKAHLALGEKAAAYEWLERGVRARAPSRQRLAADKDFAAIRDEARFKAIALDIDTTGATREEGWRVDIDLFASELKRLHYAPFRTIPEADFDRDIAALKAEVAKLDDGEVAVRLMKVLGPIADGHTQIFPPYRRGSTLRIVQMVLEMAGDELYVAAVRPGNEELLWGRVVEINGVPAGTAIAAATPLIGRDNDLWIGVRAPVLLRYPQILKPLGIGTAPDRASYTILTRTGERRTVTLEAAPGLDGPWVRRPSDAPAPPLYLSRTEDNYWFEHLPAQKLVCFQFNVVQNQPRGGETMEAFARRLAERIDREDVEHIVVDLRRNGGGNTDLFKPLLQALLGTRKAHRPGGLFVIAGRHTFSAAMNFAALLERHASPIFVGEPTGSSPNFIGENSELTLPYSKTFVSISNLYWQNALPQDHRTWIAPQLPAPPTLASLRAGRDPAMEAIETLLKAPTR